MRFISMHSADAFTEAGTPPSQELIEGMGRLMGEMFQSGAFEAGEGLRQSALGVRLKYKDGKAKATPGPFIPGTGLELTAAFTIVKAADIEAARRWADRYGEIFRDVEIDLRPVCENWDIGMAPPPPAGTPLRFMIQFKADARYEAGAPISAKELAALQKLDAEMKQAGVLLVSEAMRPSGEGLRIQYDHAKDERRVIDGPFAESKELIAGYCIMKVKDRAEVIRWTDRFASNFPKVNVEIRLLDRQE
ncbi:MAG: hypothetical protein JWN73_373 [Betaproteobacteria bacterium]|nr:hypothetical protein [Betaproteobacteria bacterium]